MTATLIVLGTGGHARSCLDVISAAGFDTLGCIGSPPNGELQAPYLGTDQCLDEHSRRGVRDLFIAVGDNRTRSRLADMARAKGFGLPSVVSPSAVISPHARIGSGVVVMHGAMVGPYSDIGDGTIVNTGASADHDCLVGRFAHIGPGTYLAGNVRIGAGAFLGVGCSAIPRVTVGDWATVGAGSTVVTAVPAHSTVAGTPARPLRQENRT